jgi:sugar lactone lactonase YvrE
MNRNPHQIALAALLTLTLSTPLVAQQTQAQPPQAPPSEVQQFEEILSASPEHVGMWVEMAAAQARAGNKAEAVKWLEKVAARGLDFDFADELSYAQVRETPEFKAVAEKILANRKVVDRSKVAFQVADKELIPEGIAHDPKTGDFFLGSLSKRKIVRIDKNGKASDFKTSGQDGLWDVLGMKVDPATRTLWVGSAANATGGEGDGSSGLFQFDLKTGKLLAKHVLPGKTEKHLLNDLAFGARGEVFVTDSEGRAILRLRPGKAELEVLVAPGTFIYPNGIASSPDGKKLFVADFTKGISVVDVATGQVRPLTHPERVNVYGIDGLYFHKGDLVAVQNGAGTSRIVRYRLGKSMEAIESEEVLESRNPRFDIPTTGVVVGRSLYYIANSQLDRLDQGRIKPDAKLAEPVVLQVPLGR